MLQQPDRKEKLRDSVADPNPDPDPIVTGMAPDPSIIKQK
jgi:hypothetical protein